MDYTIYIIIIAIIAFVIGRRLIGNKKGSKYSLRSIFLRPLIYLVLTIVFIIGLQLWQIGVIVVSVVLGIFLGMKLGERSNIFETDGKIMYKRSNDVLAIWLIAFIIRISVDLFTNPFFASGATNSSISNSTSITSILAAASQSPIIFGADILLAFSAGLLFGEALILQRNFNSKYPKAK